MLVPRSLEAYIYIYMCVCVRAPLPMPVYADSLDSTDGVVIEIG